MKDKTPGLGIIGIWTFLAIVLHFCDVGYFAKWSVIDWPWHWSCCSMLWIDAIILLPFCLVMEKKERRRKLEKYIEQLESQGRNGEAEMLKKELERMRK